MPPIPLLGQPLTDGRVALRLAAERDIPEILIAHQDDRDLHLRLGMPRPPSGAELGSQAERGEVEREAGTAVRLTILKPGDDTCRGRLAVHHLEWEQARAELGIWVAPQLRGRGLGRGALRLAAGWLFGACGLERLSLVTEPDNEPMLRAARAAGFRPEGTLRSFARAPSGRTDMTILSLLPGDLRT